MKKITLLLAMAVFLASCTQIQPTLDKYLNKIQPTIDKTGDAVDKAGTYIDSKARGFWQKDFCTRVYENKAITITTKNISNYYIIYLYQETDTRADFDLWQNLVNNRVIDIKQDGNQYTITNLQAPTIEVCTPILEQLPASTIKPEATTDGESAVQIIEGLI